MSDRYTVAVEGPDGWAYYELSDQQLGLLRAGVPASIALASVVPLGRTGTARPSGVDLIVDASGALREAPRDR